MSKKSEIITDLRGKIEAAKGTRDEAVEKVNAAEKALAKARETRDAAVVTLSTADAEIKNYKETMQLLETSLPKEK